MLNIIHAETEPDFLSFVAHPLANMFPMIEGNAFEELKRDIAAQGILEPIRLYQGMILDGRNRYSAAKAVGHHFTLDDFVEWEGTPAEAEAWVMGPEWLEDSVEFYEGWLEDLNDNHKLQMVQQGLITLSVDELLAIRRRARAGLELLLRHECKPATRKWIEKKLKPSAVWEENRRLAKAMLAEKREKERR